MKNLTKTKKLIVQTENWFGENNRTQRGELELNEN